MRPSRSAYVIAKVVFELYGFIIDNVADGNSYCSKIEKLPRRLKICLNYPDD
jgi:hypothetical protein